MLAQPLALLSRHLPAEAEAQGSCDLGGLQRLAPAKPPALALQSPHAAKFSKAKRVSEYRPEHSRDSVKGAARQNGLYSTFMYL